MTTSFSNDRRDFLVKTAALTGGLALGVIAAALLPKGTVLLITAWYDNTANNPVNPDPDQWVIFGRRTGDEMSHMWIGATYLSDEDFEFLKAQRERPVAQQQ